MPGGGERAALGFAVTDDAGDQQVRVVEGRSESMREGVSELAAFVDRARHIRRTVTRNTAGKRKLLEQPLESGRVLRDVRIHLGVAALEISVGHQCRAAVPGTDDCEYIAVPGDDHSV